MPSNLIYANTTPRFVPDKANRRRISTGQLTQSDAKRRNWRAFRAGRIPSRSSRTFRISHFARVSHLNDARHRDDILAYRCEMSHIRPATTSSRHVIAEVDRPSPSLPLYRKHVPTSGSDRSTWQRPIKLSSRQYTRRWPPHRAALFLSLMPATRSISNGTAPEKMRSRCANQLSSNGKARREELCSRDLTAISSLLPRRGHFYPSMTRGQVRALCPLRSRSTSLVHARVSPQRPPL